MTKMHWGSVWIAVLLACGGGEADTTSETTTGDEQANHDEPIDDEPYEEPIDEPEPTGPGSLTVINEIDGQESTGTVQVLDEAGEVVAEGESGQTFQLPAGRYSLVGSITDASVLMDTPTREGEDMVTVEPGGQTRGVIEHHRARVRIRVMRNNRPVARWRLEMQRRGSDETITLNPSEEYVPLSAGRYNGTVHIGDTQIEVNDVVLQGGAQRDLPIRVQ